MVNGEWMFDLLCFSRRVGCCSELKDLHGIATSCVVGRVGCHVVLSWFDLGHLGQMQTRITLRTGLDYFKYDTIPVGIQNIPLLLFFVRSLVCVLVSAIPHHARSHTRPLLVASVPRQRDKVIM